MCHYSFPSMVFHRRVFVSFRGHGAIQEPGKCIVRKITMWLSRGILSATILFGVATTVANVDLTGLNRRPSCKDLH